jgi:L-fucose isomerase-like protein
MRKTLFLPLASPLHEPQAVTEVLRQTREGLQPLEDWLQFHPLVSKREEIPASSPLVVLFVLTGGTEFLGMEVQAEEYLILVHPAMNSLPAALELRTRYAQQGKRAAILDLAGLRRVLAKKMQAWQVVESFRGSRFALIGKPSPWLVASMVPPKQIEERWGITIDRVPMEEMIQRYREQDDGSMEDWLRAPGEIGPEDRLQALRFFQSTLGFLREHPYDGISLACFDFLTATGTSGCLSLASLNDLGIVASCEGDLVSLLTMRLLSLVARRPTFMANPAWIEEDRVLLAHCTVAPSLVERFTLRTHFESGKSVALAGDFPLGTYTLAKIAPSLDGIFFAPCQSFPWQKRENLCRTQVYLHMEGAWRLKELSLANHLVLVPGDWRELLSEAAALLGLEVLA